MDAAHESDLLLRTSAANNGDNERVVQIWRVKE